MMNELAGYLVIHAAPAMSPLLSSSHILPLREFLATACIAELLLIFRVRHLPCCSSYGPVQNLSAGNAT